MAIEAWLLDILACPCPQHAALRDETSDSAPTLVCSRCATRFPVRDDIPVLLLDDAVPGPAGIGADLSAGRPPSTPGTAAT